MPLYEYFCQTCQKEVTIAMTISERERKSAVCPQCQGHDLQPLVGTFFAQTSKKS